MGSCAPCSFFHKESKQCGLGIVRNEIRNIALDSKMETNAIWFDEDAEQKYNKIANEISLEEFKIELMDFTNEYCCYGKSCSCCRFNNTSLRQCALNWVDDKLKDLLGKPNISTP